MVSHAHNKPEGIDDMWAELPTLLFIRINDRGAVRFGTISQQDAPLVSGRPWRVFAPYQKKYVVSSGRKAKKEPSTVYLHRLITSCPSELEVDHKNGNSLNNHRGNLRVCTHADNMKNKRVEPLGHNGIPGIRKTKKGSFIAMAGKRTIGRFTTIETAIEDRNHALASERGEFAPLHDGGGNTGRAASRSSSGYRGVYVNGQGFTALFRGQYLGWFKTDKEAAEHYDLAAIAARGAFACLNFPHRRPEYLKQIEQEKQSA